MQDATTEPCMDFENENEPGERCRIRVVIRARGRDHTGYVIKRSAFSLLLLTDNVEGIWTGDRIEVVGHEFGPVVGTAQWRMPRRLGMKIHGVSEADAGLRDLWRFSKTEKQPKANAKT